MAVLSYASHDALIGYWNGLGVKLALLTSAPNPDGTGINEPVSANGYARQAFTFESVTRNAGVSSVKNAGACVFGPAITADWSSVTYGALFSADGTTLLAYGPLPSSRTCVVGDSISFGIESLQFRLN
jgi:hypothetical protein